MQTDAVPLGTEHRSERVGRKLRRTFDRMEKDRKTLVSALGRWPLEQWQFRPEPTAWSAAEVIDHVVRTEREICTSISENLPKRRPVPFADKLRFSAVLYMFRFPVRVKAPGSVPGIAPDASQSLTELTVEWEKQRERLSTLLHSPLVSEWRYGAMRHPVTGWIDLPGAVAFLAVHTRHHEFQLERLRKAHP